MGLSKTIAAGEIHAAIERLASAISKRHGKSDKLWLLGIANGGVSLAKRLSGSLPAGTRLGTLDVSFHRDDVGRHPIPKEFTPTFLPGDVTDATVLLVDDVLFTGRTIKASLDELFDHGRPASVELAVLVDRGGRRLPVSADFVGLTLEAGAKEIVKVTLDNLDTSKDRIQIRTA